MSELADTVELTDGDIGGLLEAIDHRCADPSVNDSAGKARRYEEIRSKLSLELASRRLGRDLEGEAEPDSGIDGERCSKCGGAVDLVWWCFDDFLWEAVTGKAKPPGKEPAAGVWCIQCFNRAARDLCPWIEWAPVNLRHLLKPEVEAQIADARHLRRQPSQPDPETQGGDGHADPQRPVSESSGGEVGEGASGSAGAPSSASRLEVHRDEDGWQLLDRGPTSEEVEAATDDGYFWWERGQVHGKNSGGALAVLHRIVSAEEGR